MLDLFILWLPAVIITYVVLILTATIDVFTNSTLAFLVGALLAFIVAIIAIAMEGGGGTPGKRILGMRIIDATGGAPGFGKALVRNLLRVVDWLPAFFLLGAVLVVTNERKQRLGDRAAGTFVVGKE